MSTIVSGDGGDEAIATVYFWNGETKLATVYVKNSDQLLRDGTRQKNVSYLEDIVTDPGVGGTLPSGQSFRGWYIGDSDDYTVDTTPKTIEEVREYLDGLTITEATTVNVYAMIFKVYSVTYLDEDRISLGSDDKYLRTDEETAKYEVSRTYTPVSTTQNFEGWIPDDSSKITDAKYNGEAVNAPYKMGTEMTISGSVTFTVSAPDGRWLVFEENGKNATYNAPQFVKDGEFTTPPKLTMQRLGYRFDGWYTKQYADTESPDPADKFEFGNELTNSPTIIYAKWTQNAKANYTVIYWTQNVAGNGYDFTKSETIEGDVGTSLNVSSSGNRISVTGASVYSCPNGFSFEKGDSGKVVSPEGNTVVNVYVKRNEYTLNFQVYDYTYTVSTNDNDNNPAKYGDVNGQKARVYWNNGAFRTSNSRYGTVYTGTVYTRSNNQSWQTVKEIKALYEANISDNFPIVGDNGVTYDNGERWMPQNDPEWKQVMVYIETMPARNVTFRLNTSEAGTKTMNYYKEVLPGESGTRRFNNKDFALYDSVSANYNGVTVEDYIELEGCEKFGVSPAGTYDNGNMEYYTNGDTDYWGTPIAATTVDFFYTRKVYPITYMDGIYVDGKGNNVEGATSQGMWKKTSEMPHGSDLSTYNKDHENYYIPDDADRVQKGFVFEGWYIDDSCTTPYTFTTMPEGGITVYAKWRQVQYRVFLHPNAKLPDGTNDSSLHWGDEGSSEQQMNFLIAYQGKVSVPTGLRTDYDFIGWFLDEDASQPFNEDSKLTEATVTADYDKSDASNYTDPMNKFGEIEGTGFNKDQQENRFWVTKKLDLYGKWSAKLTGAEGIGIIYDANGGSSAPNDTKKYKDNVEAVAQGASTPKDATENFLYWVVQKWNGTAYEDTTEHVYPGGTFTVLKANARITDLSPEDEDYKEGKVFKAYTIQLRAEYGPADVPTPTHITWYPNFQTDQEPVTDEPLQINQAVDIKPATTFVRPGYTFVGWARMSEYEDSDVDHETPITVHDDAEAWLVFNGNAFTEDGKTVSQIAADERLPYHGMYAVWKRNPVTLTVAKQLEGSIEYAPHYDSFEIVVTVTDTQNELDKLVELNAGKDGVNVSISADKKTANITLTLVSPTNVGGEKKTTKEVVLLAGMQYEVTEKEEYTGYVAEYDENKKSGDEGLVENKETIVTNKAAKITPAGLTLNTAAAKAALLSLFAFAMMCVLGFSLKRRYVSRR